MKSFSRGRSNLACVNFTHPDLRRPMNHGRWWPVESHRLQGSLQACIFKTAMSKGNVFVAARYLAITFFALILVQSANGQAGTGEIGGIVQDASGGRLPKAKLTIALETGGVMREITTGSDGIYMASALPPGRYSIKAELDNFHSLLRQGFELQAGRQERIDFTLEIGERSDIVTVDESVPLLRTTNAEVGEVIGSRRILDLPLNGRQFVDLTLLSDNVFRAPKGTRGSALAQTGSAVLVAGQRAGHNMYYLDGVSVTDQYFNHLVANPPVDAIQEFNIQKTLYPAEFGGKASATISAVIRSGTNTLHGSLYEFFRNEVLDARNFFDPPSKPPYRQNQFGTSLGGPIVRDNSFYFVNYEGLRTRQAQTQTFSVPTSQVRNGDFSGLAVICDPLSTSGDGTRSAFSNNKIPVYRLDAAGAAFLQKMPLPNLPGQSHNLLATPVLSNDINQGIAKVDHRLSSNGNVFGHLYWANFDTFQPFGSSLLNETLVPGFGYYLTTHTKTITLGEIHSFYPNLVNELRFGFLRVAGGQISQNQGVNFAALHGLGGIAPALDQTGYPSVSFSGTYSTAGDPANLFSRRNNSFDVIDSMSWTRGANTLKLGAYIYRLQFNPSESPNARGTFTFTPRFTSSAAGRGDGSSFADFLLGHPSSAQAGVGPGGAEYGRSTWTHLHVQDDWRASRSLTLNVGLRYEINGKITDTQNRLSNVELNRFVIASDRSGRISSLAAPLLGLIPVPFVTSLAAGYHRSLQLPNYHHIAPRVGIAWSASKNTVVRAGWGLFFNQAAYNIQTALTENLPFYFNKSVNTAATTVTPTLTLSNILLAPANGTIGGSTLDYPYRSEFADNWSLDVQRALGSNWALSLSYLGSHVSGADNSTFRNVPLPGPGAIDPRRPNPLLSAFKAIRWDGWSIYHSGTIKLEKRMAGGLTLNANYTWSKSIDDASDVGSTFSETNVPQDVRNARAERALSSFDHRHRFVFSYSYTLPFGRGAHRLTENLFGGWRVTGLGSVQSGAPFTVTIPTDNANIGSGPSQRPNVLFDPNSNAPHTAQQWFNAAAFQMPAPFTFGNAGRNIVFGPNEVSLDASLQKETGVTEHIRTQFRAEIFNITNHANFADAPGRIAFTPTFGRLTSALNARQIQLAVKVLF